MAPHPLVRAEGLGFIYEGRPDAAFSGLSGSIGDGQFWLFRGPNGTGKSTALRVLAGLAPRVFSGTVLGSGRVLGASLGLGEESGLAEEVGMLPDNPWAQVSGLRTTVWGEISLGLENRGWPVGSIRTRVSELLSLMDLEHVADQSPTHLSGGEYQALGFACAIAHKPRVIILDEPELHLDPDRVSGVLGLVQAALDGGGAVVGASHLPLPLLPAVSSTWDVGDMPFRPTEDPVLPWPSPCTDLVAALHQVVFRYPGQPNLLEGIDLELRAGTITALTGANGTGKTTIAKLILGLLRPQAGKIWICGKEAQDVRASHLANNVSIAFQDPRFQLFRRTVREEITSSLRGGSDPEVPAAIAAAFGIEAGLGLSPYDLSWSHRRLAAMACAVARSPRLLILDEPTAGLDDSERARVAYLLRHWATHGGSVLLITHDWRWATAFCDTHIEMSDMRSRASHNEKAR